MSPVATRTRFGVLMTAATSAAPVTPVTLGLLLSLLILGAGLRPAATG
jgi:hypothetical protein